MKPIYLVYSSIKGEDVVVEAFSEKKAAMNYVMYWNEHTTEDNLYYFTLINLDRYAEIYEKEI